MTKHRLRRDGEDSHCRLCPWAHSGNSFTQGAGGSPRPEAKAASSVPRACIACTECEATPIQEGRDGSWEHRQPGHAAGRLQMSVFCVDRERRLCHAELNVHS